MNLPVQHNGIVTLVAGPATVVSFLANYPLYITATAGTLAVVWYVIILSEKVSHWYKAWKRRHHNSE